MKKKAPNVGQFVELHQVFGKIDNWLPFLVTQVHNVDVISGVVFSGMPNALGWGNKATLPVSSAQRGKLHNQWRFSKNDSLTAEDDGWEEFEETANGEAEKAEQPVE